MNSELKQPISCSQFNRNFEPEICACLYKKKYSTENKSARKVLQPDSLLQRKFFKRFKSNRMLMVLSLCLTEISVFFLNCFSMSIKKIYPYLNCYL